VSGADDREGDGLERPVLGRDDLTARSGFERLVAGVSPDEV